jgi:hypothetical protein
MDSYARGVADGRRMERNAVIAWMYYMAGVYLGDRSVVNNLRVGIERGEHEGAARHEED